VAPSDENGNAAFELIERWRELEIRRRRPGFEFTPMLLGKIGSYLVFDGSGSCAVFAFMYRFGTLRAEPEPDEEHLALMAVDTIKHALDEAERVVGADRTFELHGGRWNEVERPGWWIPYFS
jgi:hypothetical protein